MSCRLGLGAESQGWGAGCILGPDSPSDCFLSLYPGYVVIAGIYVLFVFQGDLVSFAWKTSSMKLPSLGSISRRSLHSCALSSFLWPAMLPRIEWASSRRWAPPATGESGSTSSSGSSTRAGAGEARVLWCGAPVAQDQPGLEERLRRGVGSGETMARGQMLGPRWQPVLCSGQLARLLSALLDTGELVSCRS